MWRVGEVTLRTIPIGRTRATLYRLPSGALVWCLRYGRAGGCETRWCVPSKLKELLDEGRLTTLRSPLDRLLARAERKENDADR